MIHGNKITTQATFIGTDGSMGLVNGKTYNVVITIEYGMIVVEWSCHYCPYQTMKALLKNWKF